MQCSKTGVLIQLPLSKPALDVLGKRKEEGIVFQSLTISILNLHVPKWLNSAGISKHITFHQSRHSFGTSICLTQGVPIETLSQMMGHRNIKTTQIYAEITGAKIEEDMQVLSEKIKNDYRLADN